MELVNNLSLNPSINSSAGTPRNGLQRYAFFPYKPKPPFVLTSLITHSSPLLSSSVFCAVRRSVLYKQKLKTRTLDGDAPKPSRRPTGVLRRFSTALPAPACHPPPPILPFGLIVLPLTCLTKIHFDHDLS